MGDDIFPEPAAPPKPPNEELDRSQAPRNYEQPSVDGDFRYAEDQIVIERDDDKA
jgi:hypothetical protein